MLSIIFLIIFIVIALLCVLVVYFFCSYAKVYITKNDGSRDIIGVLWKSNKTYTLYNDFPPLARKIGYVDQQGIIHIEKENDQCNYVSIPCGSFKESGDVYDNNGRSVALCQTPNERSSSVTEKNNDIEVAYVKSGFKKVPDVMVRAAAFGALWGDDEEVVKKSKSDVSIGFKDLALPSTIIFLLLYVLFGVCAKSFEWLPFLGSEISYVSWMLFAYFCVALILYFIKSYYTMRNKSIAFITQLININVGVQGLNIFIIILSIVGLFTSSLITNYTVIPVFLSILIGFSINALGFRGQWKVVEPIGSWIVRRNTTSLKSKGNSSQVLEAREFDWSPILKSKGITQVNPDKDKVLLYVNSNLNDLNNSEIRKANPFRNSKDRTLEDLIADINQVLKGSDASIQSSNYTERIALEQIIQSAYNLCLKYGLADFELYDLILQFCQRKEIIKYVKDNESEKIGKNPEYFRFPAETLYDLEGDCDCKSVLAYKLFDMLKAEPKFAIVKTRGSESYNHAAVVLKKNSSSLVKIPSTYKTYDDAHQYVYCEVTGQGYRPGDISDEVDIESINLI